jgi:hypothetical protein
MDKKKNIEVKEVKEVIEPRFASEKGNLYYASLSEMDKIGVQVALKTIPHVFCLERSSGFLTWNK